MTPTTDIHKAVHQGRNVKRFREMMGLKQEALADQLGGEWTQKKISHLETREVIEPELLEDLARALKVPAEAIRSFNEEAAFNIIANTIHNHDQSAVVNYYPTFNPFDKYVEEVEKNKKLYEALLKEKDEKIALMQKLLEKKP